MAPAEAVFLRVAKVRVYTQTTQGDITGHEETVDRHPYANIFSLLLLSSLECLARLFAWMPSPSLGFEGQA